jgi:hypothetical protein
MKTLWLLAALAATGGCGVAAEKPPRNPALASETLVWAGLDFSKVRMIGAGAFNDPDAIFPHMLNSWNNLFLHERISHVEKETNKRVVVDIGGVTEVNKTATPTQVITSPGPDDVIDKSHLTTRDIAEAVKSYKLDSKSGLGVVFIADRFVRVNKAAEGAVYVVGFDVASREVVFSQREVSKPSGIGFRNYWFRVIKNAEGALRQCR